MTPCHRCLVRIATLVGLVSPGIAAATPYADAVIAYDPGAGAAGSFQDPTTALGEPARTTGGPSDVTVFDSPFGGFGGTNDGSQPTNFTLPVDPALAWLLAAGIAFVVGAGSPRRP